MLSRCLYGAQLSVIIGFCAAALATVVSVVDRHRHRLSRRQVRPDHAALRRCLDELPRPHHPDRRGVGGRPGHAADHRHARPAATASAARASSAAPCVSVRENMYVHAAQSIGASTAAHPVAAHPAQRHAADHRAVHHPRRRRDPGRIGPVVPRPRRAAAGADLGRHAVGHRAAPTCSRARGWRWRRASASPSWSTPPTCSATRCATCSIRACADRDEDRRQRQNNREEAHDRTAAAIASARRRRRRCALGSAAASAQRREAAIRRHARDRHGLRDAVGAVVGPADWNWKHNHDTGQFYEQLFAADLSKSEAQRRQASVLSPTPGCRPTPSAASWPRAGSGRRTRCASRSSCARASCSRRSPA